ncbi:epididymal-specific lipocalin-6 [Apodemus sylvaticus]|uniref:epididymal-specific lipocalin-6 n=1 Tax=Apodemus sylvaticus TaxID=10129 RepID=UPI0022448B90|nr:epididymal-specific lipocalin-6 [Apodemus sylvaticus]
MKAILLTAALLALVSMPWLQAVWLGRLDPKQLLGPWYVLAVASRAKDFMAEKDMKNVEGVVVTLTPDNKLRVQSSRHGPGGCHQSTVELLKHTSQWMFENPSLGILDYRVLGTNFKDYAVVFTQLEFGDEVFNTVELYSRTEMASHEAVQMFTKWSQGLGFLSQQQAQLQKDFTCAHKILQGPPRQPTMARLKPSEGGTLPEATPPTSSPPTEATRTHPYPTTGQMQ